MTSTEPCAGMMDPTCAGGTLVALCTGGEWSACGCSGGSAASPSMSSSGTGTMSGAMTGVQTCGNGVAEGDEQCDGSDLKGMTCATLGMGSASAMLKCNTRCSFDTLMCFAAGGMSNGGTGAGGTGASAMTGSAGSGGSGM